MAQFNITLNQEEILQLLSKDHNEAFKQLLQECLNSVLKVESKEQIKAEPYERTDERRDSRNGVRERELKTRVGTLTLSVPRHRNQPFKTMLFESYSRSEAALVTSMAEMVINGVSTRKVSQIVESLCGTSISKSGVSEICKDLDKEVMAFKERPITDVYPFLLVDATYFKVRENHRIVSAALMIAYAYNDRGNREILGFACYKNESKDTWMDFLLSLKKRGLKSPLMITSDAHEGIRYAITRVYPESAWQRCQFHFSKNISEKAPARYRAGIRAELQAMYSCENITDARKKRDAIIDEYQDVAGASMQCLDEGFESVMTVLALPKLFRLSVRTSNVIERLNRELKRRSDVIGIFPNKDSLIRLMGAVLIELNDRESNRKKVFSHIRAQSLLTDGTSAHLKEIAREQEHIIAA
jgi:putative transposase